MKNVIKFFLFLAYTTSIFFFPNNFLILMPVFINVIIIIATKIKVKIILKKMLRILPFIIFTFFINCILDNYINAIWIALKLIIVCTITIVYSETTSVMRCG